MMHESNTKNHTLLSRLVWGKQESEMDTILECIPKSGVSEERNFYHRGGPKPFDQMTLKRLYQTILKYSISVSPEKFFRTRLQGKSINFLDSIAVNFSLDA